VSRLSRRQLVQGAGAVGLGLLAGCGRWPGLAAPAGKVYRIGYLRAEAPPSSDIEAFRQGLREHGYVEGKNVVIEYRWADGNEQRLRSHVTELIGLEVDLLVTSAPEATRVAKEATTTLPIVMVLVADPVAFGFVPSLARPGGNVTGFAYQLPELSGKRLELLKQAVPDVSRVAVLWNASNRYKVFDLKEAQAVADALAVELHSLPVGEPDGFDSAFEAAVTAGAGGLMTLEDPFTIAHRARIVDLARRHRLPAVYAVRPFVEAGGLMSYGADRDEQNRRAATTVAKLLQGARPADLPVERPMRFELVVNQKTVQALGLTIPHHVLLQATEVIQ
jgi:putative tryptophan/tyrosine transport system substrate-binding protein